ncbi:MAG: sodium-translocating pyrophosphatase [Brevinematales bacterium]
MIKIFRSVFQLSLLLLTGIVSKGFSQEAAEGATIVESAVKSSTSVDITWLTPLAAILALFYVVFATFVINKKKDGSERVKEIAAAIREGAFAYLKQQYSVVGVYFAVIFLLLLYISFGLKLLTPFVPFAFLTGGLFSGLSGFIGMWIATKANAKTAWASKDGLNSGLRVAFTAGSVMGMVVVGFGLLDLSLWYYGLKWYYGSIGLDQATAIKKITEAMLTFGMGASSMALFARVGGGIYTKSADVGADIVGKVEAGIPEDDPRNPATIADNVGDNVGDVAGMGADLYESYVGSIVATMALGAVAFPADPLKGITIPMVMASLGVVASLIGNFLVRTKEKEATQKVLLGALRRGIYGASLLILIMAFGIVYYVMGKADFGIFWSILIGLVVGNGIGFFTEYFTSASYKPTQKLAGQAVTGPATFVIGGISLGMLSTWISVVLVVVGVIIAYYAAGGATSIERGLYGVSISAVGMLSTLGITLSTDAYGPIADNAGGIAEMAGEEGGLGEEVRKITDALDSLGNTTAATGKGYAIGSAALTALALLAAFKDEIERIVREAGNAGFALTQNVIAVDTLSGLFIGAMAPFLFSALTMSAVGRAANKMVEEVRRQFREIPGILKGKDKPDYKKCVKISTEAAQIEMILPALIAILIPILTGTFLGFRALVGVLAGALISGFPLAIMMANSGGAWDNAKKYIEAGNYGGKGSDAHKAGVVGDTVGDPFKDTSGPSLNILIKLMTMVSLVFGSTMLALNKIMGVFKL